MRKQVAGRPARIARPFATLGSLGGRCRRQTAELLRGPQVPLGGTCSVPPPYPLRRSTPAPPPELCDGVGAVRIVIGESEGALRSVPEVAGAADRPLVGRSRPSDGPLLLTLARPGDESTSRKKTNDFPAFRLGVTMAAAGSPSLHRSPASSPRRQAPGALLRYAAPRVGDSASRRASVASPHRPPPGCCA